MRLIQYVERRAEPYPPLVGRVVLTARFLAKLTLLAQAAIRHDVFIFGFATTFFDYRELPWLRRLGKTVIHEFVGSDCRPAYMDGALLGPDPVDMARVAATVGRQLKAVRAIEAHATVIINHPPQAALCTRPFVPLLKVGIPIELADRPQARNADSETTMLLHSPSNPESKGTPRIRAAVEALKAEGHRIDYVELVGQPNARVREALARADLVIDQLYSDTPMAGFVTEAAWLGCPALIAGYAQDTWAAGLSPEEMPPTTYCRPEELETRLRELVVDGDRRRELGRQARAFVEERWGARQVAERFVALAHTPPTDWLVDPSDLDYVAGAGVPAGRLVRVVRELRERAGLAALGLADKPALESRLAAL